MNAELSTSKLHDVAHMGMRATIGVIFIVHGFGKFGNPGFGGWISSMGIPAEMQIPIALAEFIPGIFLIFGIFTRISSSLTGEHGYELDLILLASCLVVIVAGPGRVSLSYALKKVPRILQ